MKDGMFGVMKQNNNLLHCFNIEKRAIPYWRMIYKKLFDIKAIWDIRDINKGYDVKIITIDNKVIKIDEKTRDFKYFELFQKDDMVLIETCGNIELKRNGSSIYNTKADYWAYGWFNGKEITFPILFDCKCLINWLKYTDKKLEEKIAETNGLYHTRNVLVPYNIIKRFQINKEDENIINW